MPRPQGQQAMLRAQSAPETGNEAMIVAMQEKATEEQIDFVIDAMVEAGVDVHRTTGATQTILAGVGPTASIDLTQVRSAARRASRPPHQLALQAGRPRLSPRRHRGRIRQRREAWRRPGGGDGRSVLHRKRRADLRNCKAREGRWRQLSARRRIQAAQLALCVSGHGHSRPQADVRCGPRRMAFSWSAK